MKSVIFRIFLFYPALMNLNAGVMMGWEREIMEATAVKLVGEQPSSGDLKVLNVGFGLGIVSPSLVSWVRLTGRSRSTHSSNLFHLRQLTT